MVLSSDPKAWVPVKLALLKLQAHAWLEERIQAENGLWWAIRLWHAARSPDLMLAGACGVLLAVVVCLRGLVSLFALLDRPARGRA